MAGNILGTTVYYDADCNLQKLVGKKITVLGYGSQGHAHALNLKENGMDVTIGLRKDSKTWKVAEEAGFVVKETGEAVKDADVVMVLIPDEIQGDTYTNSIAPNLKKGAYLGFGHGFNIHFKKIQPREDVNVFMVAPKGPGHLVRRTFQEGRSSPIIAISSETKKAVSLSRGLRLACSCLILIPPKNGHTNIMPAKNITRPRMYRSVYCLMFTSASRCAVTRSSSCTRLIARTATPDATV